MEWNKVYRMDVLAGVNSLPDESVRLVVTSPPYFRQRDYGYPGQWGQEKNPEEYVLNLVKLFREVRRVMTEDGTVWIVLGDSYAAAKRRGSSGQKPPLINVWASSWPIQRR
jgi:DNA modification methylase